MELITDTLKLRAAHSTGATRDMAKCELKIDHDLFTENVEIKLLERSSFS